MRTDCIRKVTDRDVKKVHKVYLHTAALMYMAAKRSNGYFKSYWQKRICKVPQFLELGVSHKQLVKVLKSTGKISKNIFQNEFFALLYDRCSMLRYTQWWLV